MGAPTTVTDISSHTWLLFRGFLGSLWDSHSETLPLISKRAAFRYFIIKKCSSTFGALSNLRGKQNFKWAAGRKKPEHCLRSISTQESRMQQNTKEPGSSQSFGSSSVNVFTSARIEHLFERTGLASNWEYAQESRAAWRHYWEKATLLFFFFHRFSCSPQQALHLPVFPPSFSPLLSLQIASSRTWANRCSLNKIPSDTDKTEVAAKSQHVKEWAPSFTNHSLSWEQQEPERSKWGGKAQN